MEFRHKTLREKVHERELYIAVLKRLEKVLKGIKLELLKAKIKDLEAKQLIFESNKYL
tara:strand:- start:3 stop:176 length:174 start_codon:yes stop_codon:yes gene_type:complete